MRIVITFTLLLVAVLPPSVQAAAGHKAHVTPLPYGTWVRYHQHHVLWPDGRPDDRSGWLVTFPVRVVNRPMVAPQRRHTPTRKTPKKAATRRVSVPRGRTQTWLITYYLATGNPMANGQMPFIGAAACGYDVRLGTRIYVAGLGNYTCLDRIGYRPWMHADLFDVPLGTGYRAVTILN